MRRNIYAACFSLLTLALSAQSPFEVKVLYNTRSDYGLSYNFFVGEDADDFRTTIRGFGSGFLLDAFSGRYSMDFLQIGTEGVHLTAGIGGAITKYRFSEPIMFIDENGEYGYALDTDPAHAYGSGFFSNDKSKLVMLSLIVPVNLNFDLGQFYLSAGGTMDVYVSAKHKLKYTRDGDRIKEVIRNDRMNDFPFNKVKAGLGFMLLHKKTGLSAGATYIVTPFFDSDSDFPELNEVRVSFSYDLSQYTRDKR
jgi:hypothetical protein